MRGQSVLMIFILPALLNRKQAYRGLQFHADSLVHRTDTDQACSPCQCVSCAGTNYQQSGMGLGKQKKLPYPAPSIRMAPDTVFDFSGRLAFIRLQ